MEQLFTLILDKGLSWTVVVVILLYVCKRLYDDKEATQEKRIQENKDAIATIAASTAALNALTELIKAQRSARDA